MRRCYRRKDGKRHAYWALVESYRTARGPRQRVVAYLGEMDERGRLGVRCCAQRRREQQTSLFPSPEPEWVEVEVKESEAGVTIRWSKNEGWRAWAELNEGCYLLRTNVTDWSAEDLWQAYIQLTEAEAAFRIHKSDLKIHPVWHQKEDRVLAHILVCFLAYVLWKTLQQMPHAAGLGDEPRRIFEALGKISLVDVILPTRMGVDIRRRCVSKPTDHQAILLSRLGLNLPRQLTK